MSAILNTGDVRPQSVGPDYPFSILVRGAPGALTYEAANLHDARELDRQHAPRRSTYAQASADWRANKGGTTMEPAIMVQDGYSFEK